VSGIVQRFRRESVLFFVVLAAFAGVASHGGWLQRLDLALYDLWLVLAPPAVDPDIRIVGLDERSLQRWGRWPWPRELQAELLNRLAEAQPRAVLLDVVYGTADDAAADHALISAAGAVPVLALPLIIDAVSGGGPLVEVLPFPDLLDTADALGHVHVELDQDAIVRGVYLYQGVGEPVWPHLTLALAQRLDEPGAAAVADSARCAAPADVSLQNVRCNYVYVPFAGPPGTFPEISAADLLDGSVPAGALRNRVVLVGITTTAAADLVTVPVSRQSRPMSGVEFNAHLLNGILGDALLRAAPLSWVYLLTLLCVSVPALMLPRLNPRAMLGGALAAALLPAVLSSIAHLAFHRYLPLGAALVAALAAYPYWSWRRHEIAWRFVDQEMSRLSVERSRWLPPAAATDPRAAQRLAVLLDAELVDDASAGSPGGDRLTIPDSASLALQRNRPFSPGERKLAAALLPAKPSGDHPQRLPGERLAARIRQLQQAAADVRLGREAGLLGLQQMPSGVLVLSALGEILLQNDAAGRLLGQPKGGGTGFPDCLSALVPPLGQSWLGLERSVVLEQRTVAFETRGSAASPNATLLLEAAPLAAPGDPVLTWVITLTDMTAIRLAEQERAEALAFLSHDLRSPLLSVLALVRAAEPAEVLARIGRYAQRGLAVSEQFLQLSRVQATERIETYEVDLLLVVANAMDQTYVLARDKQIRLVREDDGNEAAEGLWLVGNGELLERALCNLLDNAVKYGPAGSAVSVAVRVAEGRVAVSVSDSGPGVPAEERTRVFEPYFRSAVRELAALRGAGLGLRFVHTVAARHGGSVRIDEAPGGGCRVILVLPLKGAARPGQ
jgi:CHASE2 domain-containing sensor protein/signal transduction histidine kinase